MSSSEVASRGSGPERLAALLDEYHRLAAATLDVSAGSAAREISLVCRTVGEPVDPYTKIPAAGNASAWEWFERASEHHTAVLHSGRREADKEHADRELSVDQGSWGATCLLWVLREEAQGRRAPRALKDAKRSLQAATEWRQTAGAHNVKYAGQYAVYGALYDPNNETTHAHIRLALGLAALAESPKYVISTPHLSRRRLWQTKLKVFAQGLTAIAIRHISPETSDDGIPSKSRRRAVSRLLAKAVL